MSRATRCRAASRERRAEPTETNTQPMTPRAAGDAETRADTTVELKKIKKPQIIFVIFCTAWPLEPHARATPAIGGSVPT